MGVGAEHFLVRSRHSLSLLGLENKGLTCVQKLPLFVLRAARDADVEEVYALSLDVSDYAYVGTYASHTPPYPSPSAMRREC